MHALRFHLKRERIDIRSLIVIINLTLLHCPQKREPAYSQLLIQNKILRHGIKIQRVKQADSQTAMVDGVWSWDGEGGTDKG